MLTCRYRLRTAADSLKQVTWGRAAEQLHIDLLGRISIHAETAAEHAENESKCTHDERPDR